MSLGLLAPLPPADAKPPRPAIGVGLFLLNDAGQFMLLQRQGSHGAGCWGLVGGHLEWGKTPQEAAADEAGEEVGVTLDPPRSRSAPTPTTSSRTSRSTT